MSNSLADQLLKAGLIDKKKADQAEKSKHKARVQQTKNKKKKDRGKQDTELNQQLRQEKHNKAVKDRELNAQRQAAADKKSRKAQAKQIVEQNRLPLPDPNKDETVDYNFADGKTVCRLSVTAEQHRLLSEGAIAIARLGKRYALVPGTIADRLSERTPEAIVVRHTKQEAPKEDDPYADYEVPDDLMW